jgi:hypothetical protein
MPKIHDAIIAGIAKELKAYYWYEIAVYNLHYPHANWYSLTWLQDDEGNWPTAKIAITDGKIFISDSNTTLKNGIDLSDPNLINIIKTKLPCPKSTTQ